MASSLRVNDFTKFSVALASLNTLVSWVMHAEKSFNGTSLNAPVFDIHYNARLEGYNDTQSQEIEYALVITVESPKVLDLYDKVVCRYATQLEQLVPVIELSRRV